MTATDYLAEVPATFNDLARQFSNTAPPDELGQAVQHRRDGVLESHAGTLASEVLAHLVLLVDNDHVTLGQLWSAIAAERGNVGACNMMANLSRAAHGQLVANKRQ